MVGSASGVVETGAIPDVGDGQREMHVVGDEGATVFGSISGESPGVASRIESIELDRRPNGVFGKLSLFRDMWFPVAEGSTSFSEIAELTWTRYVDEWSKAIVQRRLPFRTGLRKKTKDLLGKVIMHYPKISVALTAFILEIKKHGIDDEE